MKELNKNVSSEKAAAYQKDSKNEGTKPSIVKKVKTENKKPAEPKETPQVSVIASAILSAEANNSKEKKNDGKKPMQKYVKEGEEDFQKEAASIENQEETEPDKKQKNKIKVIKKNAQKAEEKVDMLKNKVKKAKKKKVKSNKLKVLKEKLGKALDKLKNKIKKLKKAKK